MKLYCELIQCYNFNVILNINWITFFAYSLSTDINEGSDIRYVILQSRKFKGLNVIQTIKIIIFVEHHVK